MFTSSVWHPVWFQHQEITEETTQHQSHYETDKDRERDKSSCVSLPSQQTQFRSANVLLNCHYSCNSVWWHTSAFTNSRDVLQLLCVICLHKNIICLQILRKHVKITYLFLCQLFCFEMCVFCQNVSFCFGLRDSAQCQFTPGCQVGGKHSILQPWKPANELGQRSQTLPDLKSLRIHPKNFK